jgi:polysaccharide biosynthesis transport protein
MEQQQEIKTIGDVVAIVKRRKLSLVLPALAVFILAAIAAFLWPPVYRSTSTILIEEQEIPREFVVGTITSFAEQRLQTINQRIMSTTRLLTVINQFNLYADIRSRVPTEEVIEKMRKDIKLSTISADVIDPKTGRPASATIAFSLAYDGRNPETVQKVANQLASLYLEENMKEREKQTVGASKFLEDEAKGLQAELTKLDARISGFKGQHVSTLPELLQANLQGLDRVENDIDRLRDQLRTLKEREGYLQTQLATIPTDTVNQDKTLLKELKAKLVQLQSRVSDKYPDVIKTKAEIAELEKRLNEQPKGEGKISLAGLSLLPSIDQPDNPAYVTIASQLVSTQAEIDSVQRQIKDTGTRREDYRQRTEATPRVEETYKALMMERNNLQLKYDDLMKKVMEAHVAHGLEKEQMGEHFTLIDPARLPERPVKPNVPAVLIVGLVLGIGAGIGGASIREYSDQSVRSAADLVRLTAYPVLGVIPKIVTWKDRIQASRRRKITIALIVAIIIIGLAVFHFFIMDLDVVTAKIARRLSI